MKIVLLGADSLDAIRVTHSNCFEDTVDAFGHLCADLGVDSSEGIGARSGNGSPSSGREHFSTSEDRLAAQGDGIEEAGRGA